jgi:hypothetical protein
VKVRVARCENRKEKIEWFNCQQAQKKREKYRPMQFVGFTNKAPLTLLKKR